MHYYDSSSVQLIRQYSISQSKPMLLQCNDKTIYILSADQLHIQNINLNFYIYICMCLHVNKHFYVFIYKQLHIYIYIYIMIADLL